MPKFFHYLFTLLFIQSAFAQVGTWESLPTLTEIRAMLSVENEVLLATDGGVLRFDKTARSFDYGIQSHQTQNFDVSTIYIDSDSLLWVGSNSPGPITEVIDLKDGKHLPVEFVELDQISSYVEVGDSVYATYKDGIEGGLLLYRKGSNEIEYRDLFNNFPGQSSLDLTSISDVLHLDGKLIFRTRYRILWVELDGSNLKDPSNWSVSAVPGDNLEINRMAAYGDVLLLAVDSKLYTYDYSTYSEILSTSNTITDFQIISAAPALLVYTNSVGIHEYDLETAESNELTSGSGITSIATYLDEVWMSSDTDFLSLWSNQIFESFSANRPGDHFFNRMLTIADGNLVAAAYNGISIHSGEGWRTIKPGDVNSAFDESAYNWDEMIVDTLEYPGRAVVEDMIQDLEGNLYLSLQGKGVLRLDDEQPGESRFFNAVDGVLTPTYDSETYILPAQMAVDSRNNVWLTTKLVQDGANVLTIMGAEDSIYHISQYQGGLGSRTIKSIAIDDNNLVWLGSQVWSPLQALGGINLIDYEGDLNDMSDLKVSTLLGVPPLASNDILQLEVDSRNTLWILTPAGVQSMVLPDKWLTSDELKAWASLYMTSKSSDYYYYWQLTDYNVTGIEIDQRGNHWFLSSNAGIQVLLDNGRWINGGFGYNSGNSELLDNEIFSIAFDAHSGRAFISTPKGISIFNTPFADPKEDYSGIHIYPQPFNPDIHEKVIIQGLMDNSSVKILTISGTLVKELTSQENNVQGFEAHWDGHDSSGDVVGSGVYLLYLYNEEGNTSGQKIAVLR
ncbi:hypothetical protein HQ531_09070 [bacterium]|nr:hypothetical protein [bacterium]